LVNYREISSHQPISPQWPCCCQVRPIPGFRGAPQRLFGMDFLGSWWNSWIEILLVGFQGDLVIGESHVPEGCFPELGAVCWRVAAIVLFHCPTK
jgi:hypothetical protein